MTDQELRETVIRHDEQLKALSSLPQAVNELTAQLRVANTASSYAIKQLAP